MSLVKAKKCRYCQCEWPKDIELILKCTEDSKKICTFFDVIEDYKNTMVLSKYLEPYFGSDYALKKAIERLLKPKIETKTVYVQEKVKKWKFIFPLIVFILAFLLTFYLWFDLTQANKVLLERYSNRSTELENFKKKYENEKQGRREIYSRYSKLKKHFMNTTFCVGDRNWFVSGGFDSNYKQFFYVYKKLLLKSVYVRPENEGIIKIVLYDMSDKKLRQTDWIELLNPKGWQKVSVNFEIDIGRYYLMFEGDTELFYHSKDLLYPYKINGVVEITGIDKNDNYLNQNYYQYFFDWEIALLFD